MSQGKARRNRGRYYERYHRRGGRPKGTAIPADGIPEGYEPSPIFTDYCAEEGAYEDARQDDGTA